MIGILVLLVAPVAYVAVQVRRGRLRLPSAVVAALWFGITTVVMALLVLDALLADEGALPPDDLGRRLPAGLEVARQDQQCGSGGCWREYTVRDSSGAVVDAVADRLRAAGLEGCRRSVWMPDLRQRCTYVSVHSDKVLVSVNLEGL